MRGSVDARLIVDCGDAYADLHRLHYVGGSVAVWQCVAVWLWQCVAVDVATV
jgi:hypothetical protein